MKREIRNTRKEHSWKNSSRPKRGAPLSINLSYLSLQIGIARFVGRQFSIDIQSCNQISSSNKITNISIARFETVRRRKQASDRGKRKGFGDNFSLSKTIIFLISLRGSGAST